MLTQVQSELPYSLPCGPGAADAVGCSKEMSKGQSLRSLFAEESHMAATK